MKQYTFPVLASFLVMVAAVGTAQATLLSPGQTLVLVAPEPDPVGGVVVDTISLPFATANYTGVLTSTVIAGDVSNPWGGLTFVYELKNDDTSVDAIHRLTVNSFNAFQTDASYQFVAGTQAPTTADRSVNGDVVGFGFIGAPLGWGALLPAMTSAPLVVQTDAPAYQRTFASVIDGTVTSVGTFSPIPEPMTLAFVGLGFGLTLVRRRR